MMIIRKKLTPAELQDMNQRYNPDCDCIQTTIDGGATWQDTPQADPRTSPAFVLPMPARDDPACSSATGVVNNFRDGLNAVLDNLNATGNALGAASVVLTILDFISGIGLIIQLFIDFCALILSIGTELVAADFTDSVYNQLLCNIYCNCGADGTFTQAQFDKILTDNASSFGEFSAVNLILNSWLNGLGWVGLNNVAAVKGAAGDCSLCECTWCYEWPNTASLLADGWQAFDNVDISKFFGYSWTGTLTKVSFEWTSDGIGEGGDSAAAVWGTDGFSDRLILVAPLSGAPNPIVWEGSEAVTGITFGLNSAAGSGGVIGIGTVHLEGVGSRPAWTHGTDCS